MDQSNVWTLSNGNFDPSLFFRDPLHLIEEGNVKFLKLIVNSIALSNKIYFSSNTDWPRVLIYSNICKIKGLVSFALTLNEADFNPLSPPILYLNQSFISTNPLSPPIYVHKRKEITFSRSSY